MEVFDEGFSRVDLSIRHVEHALLLVVCCVTYDIGGSGTNLVDGDDGDWGKVLSAKCHVTPSS